MDREYLCRRDAALPTHPSQPECNPVAARYVLCVQLAKQVFIQV
jgi:hypothetical protein